MSTLYLCSQKTKLRFMDNHFVLTTFEDEYGRSYEVKRVSGRQIDSVLAFGIIAITREALTYCMSNGITVSYFSSNGKYIGSSVSNEAKCSELKLCQYARYFNDVHRLYLAKMIVMGKIRNQIATLKYFSHNRDNAAEQVDQVISQMEMHMKRIGSAESVRELDGIEGVSASLYFGIWRRFLPRELGFVRRIKHPATDPVNAMLSLGYTLLTNLIRGIAVARGLEPSIGYLHEQHSNRPSLACDLIEEFRAPIVDRFVVRGCNLQQFRPEMFSENDPVKGVRFKGDFIRAFFSSWEMFISKNVREYGVAEEDRKDLISLIVRQVDRIAGVIRNGGVYEPFRF